MDTSTKQYSMRNCKATMKRQRVWIKMKKNSSAYDIKVRERTSSTYEKKKRHGMVMFVYMNAFVVK